MKISGAIAKSYGIPFDKLRAGDVFYASSDGTEYGPYLKFCPYKGVEVLSLVNYIPASFDGIWIFRLAAKAELFVGEY